MLASSSMHAWSQHVAGSEHMIEPQAPSRKQHGHKSAQSVRRFGAGG